MTKSESILSKKCNRYVNGICTTVNCVKRGNPNYSLPLDFKKSTCEIHEAILEVRALEEDAWNYNDFWTELFGSQRIDR